MLWRPLGSRCIGTLFGTFSIYDISSWYDLFSGISNSLEGDLKNVIICIIHLFQQIRIGKLYSFFKIRPTSGFMTYFRFKLVLFLKNYGFDPFPRTVAQNDQ